ALAAVLMLGAQGVNLGTRFLAATETALRPEGKKRVLEARSCDTTRAEFMDELFPPPAGTYPVKPRLLTTTFVEKWNQHPEGLKEQITTLRDVVKTSIEEGRLDELMPMAGQGCGEVREILPAAEIVARIVREAEETLKRSQELMH